MEKSLRNMTPAVFYSALFHRNTWYSRPIVWIVLQMRVLVFVTSMVGHVVLALWWVLGLTPFFEASFADSRSTVLWLLLALQVVALISYWAHVLIVVPWAERGWPCVVSVTPPFAGGLRDEGLRKAFIGGAAWPAMEFAVMQAISIYLFNVAGSPFVWSDVWYALGALGIGLVGILLDFYPPTLGFKLPSKEEFMAVREARLRRQRDAQSLKESLVERDKDYALPVNAMAARMRFADIYGMQALKAKLLEPARLVVGERPPHTEAPRNGILLHGEPGNGKTVFAEALAGELQVPFIQMTYGDVSAKWLGEMPRVIANIFAYAKRTAPCVLFIDEIDSFISTRDQSWHIEDQKVTNTLLTEIVNLRSHKVVLIGATNYLKNLDTAAVREGRFDFKVEVTPPDEEARLGLLGSGLAKHAKGVSVDQDELVSVAKRWNGFSVSRIMAIAKAIPAVMENTPGTRVRFEHWMAALREVQGRKGRLPPDTKALSELVLPADTRDAIGMVAARLRDAHAIEAYGGTLPTGLLFYGPSGTGKTATARALAKEAGWAFLAVAGPDLMADRKALDRLFTEAKDLRPTIVFIDEADDVLRNRQYSANPEICNKLLVLMDGSEERVKDVVLIAATNNPDQIDPALLRSGRFTEKIEFSPPPSSEMPRFVASWLKARKVRLDDDLDVVDLADAFASMTIADVEGAMQYALNKAIAERGEADRPTITADHVQAAVRVVFGRA